MPTAPCCWHLGRRRFALTGSSSVAMAQAKRLRAPGRFGLNERHIVSPRRAPPSIEALPKAPMQLSAILLAEPRNPLGMARDDVLLCRADFGAP